MRINPLQSTLCVTGEGILVAKVRGIKDQFEVDGAHVPTHLTDAATIVRIKYSTSKTIQK